MCNFHTKICDLIRDYDHHGENHPHKEVEDGFIFVNCFVKKEAFWPIFYGTLLNRSTLDINPTDKT